MSVMKLRLTFYALFILFIFGIPVASVCEPVNTILPIIGVACIVFFIMYADKQVKEIETYSRIRRILILIKWNIVFAMPQLTAIYIINKAYQLAYPDPPSDNNGGAILWTLMVVWPAVVVALPISIHMIYKFFKEIFRKDK